MRTALHEHVSPIKRDSLHTLIALTETLHNSTRSHVNVLLLKAESIIGKDVLQPSRVCQQSAARDTVQDEILGLESSMRELQAKAEELERIMQDSTLDIMREAENAVQSVVQCPTDGRPEKAQRKDVQTSGQELEWRQQKNPQREFGQVPNSKSAWKPREYRQAGTQSSSMDSTFWRRKEVARPESEMSTGEQIKIGLLPWNSS